MAALVHLVRHGEVHNPRHVVYGDLPGFGLSDDGRAEAREAGRYLASRPVVAVWSSPLERALESAHLIAARHQLPVRVDPELTEWNVSRDWVGVRWEELPERFPGQLEAYLESPWDLPFALESLGELGERMVAAVKALDRRHPEGDVVVVGHQDPIQTVRILLTGRDLRQQHRDKPVHGAVCTLRPGTPWKDLGIWAPGS